MRQRLKFYDSLTITIVEGRVTRNKEVFMMTFRFTAKSARMLKIYRSTVVESENEAFAVARFAAMVGMTNNDVREQFTVVLVPTSPVEK